MHWHTQILLILTLKNMADMPVFLQYAFTSMLSWPDVSTEDLKYLKCSSHFMIQSSVSRKMAVRVSKAWLSSVTAGQEIHGHLPVWSQQSTTQPVKWPTDKVNYIHFVGHKSVKFTRTSKLCTLINSIFNISLKYTSRTWSISQSLHFSLNANHHIGTSTNKWSIMRQNYPYKL